jgi:hypothetical protein
MGLHGLYRDSFNSLYLTTSSVAVDITSTLRREAVVVSFEVLSQNLPGDTEEDYEGLQPGLTVLRATISTRYLANLKQMCNPLDCYVGSLLVHSHEWVV